MKKVGQIFSLIGGILGILTGVGIVISSIVMFCLNVPEIKDAFLEGMQKLSDLTKLQFIDYANLMISGATVSAIINLIFAVICFVAAGLSFVCHKNKSYIPTIVLGVLAYCQVFIILGAIFGIIFDKKQE